MKQITRLFGILLLIMSLGCDSDNPNDPNRFIFEQALFGCEQYEPIPFAAGFQVNEITEFAGMRFFGGFDSLLVTDAVDQRVLLLDTIPFVRDFIEWQGNLLIATEGGIFEAQPDLMISRITDLTAIDFFITSDNDLIFSTLGNDFIQPNTLWQYGDSGITRYSDGHRLALCATLTDLAEASNGDIWGLTCAGVVRFRNREFLDFFDQENTGLLRTVNTDETFMLPYGDDMIYLSKNGGFYQVLKYAGDEWITLFEIGEEAPTTDRDIEMSKPSLVNAVLRDDRVYIATSFAGCRGVHVFDVSKNTYLAPTDYYVIQDPNLTSGCITAFEPQANGEVLVVQDGVLTVIDCP